MSVFIHNVSPSSVMTTKPSSLKANSDTAVPCSVRYEPRRLYASSSSSRSLAGAVGTSSATGSLATTGSSATAFFFLGTKYKSSRCADAEQMIPTIIKAINAILFISLYVFMMQRYKIKMTYKEDFPYLLWGESLKKRNFAEESF